MTRKSRDAKRASSKSKAEDAADDASDEDSDEDEEREGERPSDERGGDAAEDDGGAEDAAEADSEPPPSGEDSDDESGDSATATSDDEDGDAAKVHDAKADDDDDEGVDSEVPESAIGLPTGAAWAQPLVKLEHRWTWLEVRLMFASLLALTVVLVGWASMGAMSDPVASSVVKGTLFRMIVGASVLSLVARLATRGRLDETKRTWVTVVAVVLGIYTARFWRDTGIDFFSGFNDWLQKGSVFALFGGLKGVSTRLTMFVSLLGGSLAAASGTHIAIDAVVRIIPKHTRRPAAIVAACATALVCFMAAWGFFDHVAITTLGAKVKDTPSQKVSSVTESLGEHWFLFRKQLKLDWRTFPHVLGGGSWDDPKFFTGADWNQFVDENGFAERYGEDISKVRAPDSALDSGYQPFVKRPGPSAQGELEHGVDLMWPFGFLMIGLRFLLRAILMLGGHVHLELEVEGEDDDEEEEGGEPAKEAA